MGTLDPFRSNLEQTVETLIDLDEPEALLATLQRQAKRRTGTRWAALAEALAQAEQIYDVIIRQKNLPLSDIPEDAA